MQFSLGIGITNKCNYNCSHCYSREDVSYDLPFDAVRKICDNLNIKAINLGTGESCLHVDYHKIIRFIHERGIKMGLTSNGYSVEQSSDEELKMFNDIDFSLDFPDSEAHDDFRGIGATAQILNGIERCKKLGVECSFACAMLKENYMMMDEMAKKAQELGLNLRVNIYKPVFTRKHSLTYDEFWEGIRRLFYESNIVSCSEPIVNVLIGNKTMDGGSPCGKKSLRIQPNGGIVPCVYYKESLTNIDELIEKKMNASKENFLEYLDTITHEKEIIPVECEDCDSVDVCKGGCIARRKYNDLSKPDEYCFKLNGRTPPQIDYRWGDSKDLVHSSYLCTIIVN